MSIPNLFQIPNLAWIQQHQAIRFVTPAAALPSPCLPCTAPHRPGTSQHCTIDTHMHTSHAPAACLIHFVGHDHAVLPLPRVPQSEVAKIEETRDAAIVEVGGCIKGTIHSASGEGCSGGEFEGRNNREPDNVPVEGWRR